MLRGLLLAGWGLGTSHCAHTLTASIPLFAPPETADSVMERLAKWGRRFGAIVDGWVLGVSVPRVDGCL